MTRVGKAVPRFNRRQALQVCQLNVSHSTRSNLVVVNDPDEIDNFYHARGANQKCLTSKGRNQHGLDDTGEQMHSRLCKIPKSYGLARVLCSTESGISYLKIHSLNGPAAQWYQCRRYAKKVIKTSNNHNADRNSSRSNSALSKFGYPRLSLGHGEVF